MGEQCEFLFPLGEPLNKIHSKWRTRLGLKGEVTPPPPPWQIHTHVGGEVEVEEERGHCSRSRCRCSFRSQQFYLFFFPRFLCTFFCIHLRFPSYFAGISFCWRRRSRRGCWRWTNQTENQHWQANRWRTDAEVCASRRSPIASTTQKLLLHLILLLLQLGAVLQWRVQPAGLSRVAWAGDAHSDSGAKCKCGQLLRSLRDFGQRFSG